MFDAAVAGRVRMLGLDVDGVLTANDTWIGEVNGAPIELKRFDIQDGLGFRLLRAAAIDVAWVTGRVSPSTLMRAAELKVRTVITVDPAAKVAAIEQLLGERGLVWADLAFVGDDLADLPVLQKVGLPIAVANAREEVKAVATYITRAEGGHGAVREVIDGLLKARGEFDRAVSAFFSGDTSPA
jgi:3-deoxy-D-manno-octulosonate 8-phosphate phosphatase (KDO 8-P phosphatase)